MELADAIDQVEDRSSEMAFCHRFELVTREGTAFEPSWVSAVHEAVTLTGAKLVRLGVEYWSARSRATPKVVLDFYEGWDGHIEGISDEENARFAAEYAANAKNMLRCISVIYGFEDGE